MKFLCSFSLAFGLLAMATISTMAAAVQSDYPAANRTPVLLELFTSEGCSSCPPADKLLQALDQSQPIPGADLIVLSEHVDYWNHGGWSDPFSSPAFSARQRDYADKLGLDSVYTPQLIVDSSAELVGSNAVKARSDIEKAVRRNKIPIRLTRVVRQGDRLSVHVELDASAVGKRSAIVYVALADNEERSQVAHGENAGRSLTHVAVVRTLMPIGTLSVSGFSKDVTIPLKVAGQNGLRIVAFVQEKASHQVLGVVQQKL